MSKLWRKITGIFLMAPAAILIPYGAIKLYVNNQHIQPMMELFALILVFLAGVLGLAIFTDEV